MSNNNLKFYRKQKGITQKELARVFGVTNDYISLIERGKQTPSLSLAKRIADYFDTTVDTIFFENETNKTFEKISNSSNKAS